MQSDTVAQALLHKYAHEGATRLSSICRNNRTLYGILVLK